MVADPRFATSTDRAGHLPELVGELETTFAGQPLAHWREQLATQKGQWDVVRLVGELQDDSQAQINFVQRVDYGQGRELPLVACPVQFDMTPPVLRPAPELGGDTDEVLQSIGMDMDAIIDAKISGAVL